MNLVKNVADQIQNTDSTGYKKEKCLRLPIFMLPVMLQWLWCNGAKYRTSI